MIINEHSWACVCGGSLYEAQDCAGGGYEGPLVSESGQETGVLFPLSVVSIEPGYRVVWRSVFKLFPSRNKRVVLFAVFSRQELNTPSNHNHRNSKRTPALRRTARLGGRSSSASASCWRSARRARRTRPRSWSDARGATLRLYRGPVRTRNTRGNVAKVGCEKLCPSVPVAA